MPETLGAEVVHGLESITGGWIDKWQSAQDTAPGGGYKQVTGEPQHL